MIAFILKLLFMKLFKKFFDKKLKTLRKDSQEVIIKKIGGKFMKIKKCHVISLIVDTILVILLALVSTAEILGLTIISEVLYSFGLEGSYTIAALSGVLMITLGLQYKTTLSDYKCEKPDGNSKSSDENSKELRIREINDELIKLFNNGGEKK